uniref:Uncharacterized protein n=1 Tax=Salix viminalis TaxID=40686 RepID=A0A6N2KJA6_SALVM
MVEICDERLLKTVDAIPAKSKRAKRLDTNPGLGSSRSSLVSETERRRENFGYFVEKLGSDGGGGSDRCLKSPQNEQVGEMVIEVNSSARECSGESAAKRELEFFTEVIESELEGNDATLRFANDGVDEREANGFRNTREGHYARKSMDDLERLAMLEGRRMQEHDTVLSDDLYGSSDHTIRCVGDTSEEEQYDQVDLEFIIHWLSKTGGRHSFFFSLP